MCFSLAIAAVYPIKYSLLACVERLALTYLIVRHILMTIENKWRVVHWLGNGGKGTVNLVTSHDGYMAAAHFVATRAHASAT